MAQRKSGAFNAQQVAGCVEKCAVRHNEAELEKLLEFKNLLGRRYTSATINITLMDLHELVSVCTLEGLRGLDKI